MKNFINYIKTWSGYMTRNAIQFFCQILENKMNLQLFQNIQTQKILQVSFMNDLDKTY